LNRASRLAKSFKPIHRAKIMAAFRDAPATEPSTSEGIELGEQGNKKNAAMLGRRFVAS
jgi:hypothetical protein